MGSCPIFGPTVSVRLLLCCWVVVVGSLVLISGDDAGQGMKCSGYCTKDTMKCQLRGGKIVGFCNKNLMCCDPLVSATGSCGDRKSDQKTVFFRSPSFPEYAGGDLLCDFKVRIRNDTLAIRVDFLQADMDGLSFDGGGENMAHCESDMIFIRGFNTWAPPARCGNLTGYGVLIDIETRQTRNLGMLSIVALMSSPRYRFNVRIVQITKNSEVVQPSDSRESIAKRSVLPNNAFPQISPTPTKILIKTVKPAELASLAFRDSSFYAEHQRDSFKIFDSLYPTNWKSPSIVNGEDTVISTVPWQVSLRLMPEAIVPPPMTDFINMHSSTEASSLETSFDSTSPVFTSEDELTTEDSYPYPNCSETEGIHFCGGSILDKRHVLSAAHCFFGSSKLDGMMNISSIMVVVGDTNKCTEDEDEQGIFPGQEQGLKSYRYGVESIIFHYGYDHSLLINDVAVLRLNESIKYFKHVKPITLARQGDDFEGHEAMLSGWGDRFTEGNTNNYSVEETMGPSILQSTRLLQIQNRSFCNEREISQYGAPQAQIIAHGKYMHAFDSTICTLTKNGSKVEVNTGRGDSGGPLISYYDAKGQKHFDNNDGTKEPVLVGVVSYSIPFDEKVFMYDGLNRTVDFYTSVSFYRNWIDLVVKSLEQIVKNVI